MKEKLISLVGDKLDSLNLFIDSVQIISENKTKTLEVILDRDNEFIDLKTIVKATRILNPIIDEMKLDIDTLDVFAKEKGGNYE